MSTFDLEASTNELIINNDINNSVTTVGSDSTKATNDHDNSDKSDVDKSFKGLDEKTQQWQSI